MPAAHLSESKPVETNTLHEGSRRITKDPAGHCVLMNPVE